MLPLNIRQVLQQRPLGLVFDIYGTLSPIAPTPDEARVYPGVGSLLERACQDAHVAIITGRAVEDGARMVNIEGLTYIGTHGIEWSDGLPSSHPVHIVPEALAEAERGKYLFDVAEQKLAGVPGIILQRKQVGGSIHYRLHPNPQGARKMILSALEEPARRANMRLSEGKCIIEIKAPLVVNKGQALRRFVERFELQGVIYAGDDRTDSDAILEIPRLRQEGIAALAIVVQQADTFPGLLEHADVVVQGIGRLVRLSSEMVRLLQEHS